MKIQHSVSTRIAHYLFLIIIFAGIITSLSLAIMASNRSDAELINVAGSLRMQTYRLAYEMEYEPNKIEIDLRNYRVSLHSNVLAELNNQFFVPDSVKQTYHNLIYRWQEMEQYIRSGEQKPYYQQMNNYVDQVDKFVYGLQRFAEQKLNIAVAIISISMLLIVTMVSYVIWYTRKQVVTPLHQLTEASIQLQKGQFIHNPLNISGNNELGTLAKVFTEMSNELHKLYLCLEEKVNEKTQKLSQANRSLTMLYSCSQQLTTSDIERQDLEQVLRQIKQNEHLNYIELNVYGAEHWKIEQGNIQPHIAWQQNEIAIENNKLGILRWQAGLPCPDPRSMKNIAQMLGRALYFHQTQRQQQQLLLMEERSIIARELHDSLAQVLSFLQIQLTLLKHNIKKSTPNAIDNSANDSSLLIIKEFEQALSDGYIQLRELLATFRLTIQEANLKIALEQVIESLQNQTEMNISINCSLPSQTFTPQQLIHALQIVREAILNAIKHSQGTMIEVIAHTNSDGENELIVRDNGIGIISLEEPEGHYGLNIMQERCSQLNAKLIIQRLEIGGTEVKILLN